MEQKLDENLYSRQIGTYGAETMGKLIKMRVFIQGLRGLGVEVAKNLILAGPAEVVLHDPELVQIQDLGSNFYLREDQVGKSSRAEASCMQLQELNSYVKVSVFNQQINENLLENFDVVVFTECYDQSYLEKIDEFCRSRKIGFIYGGYFFELDFWVYMDLHLWTMEMPSKFLIKTARS